jgi:hypothetical protein
LAGTAAGSAPGFEDENAHAALCEPGRDHSSAGAAADDDIVEDLDAPVSGIDFRTS